MRSPIGKVALLSLGRIGIGATSLARPEIVGRLFGAEPDDNAQLTLLVRLFGAREVALGAITLTSVGPGRSTALLAGIAVDAADATTAFLALRDDDVPQAQGSALAGIAVGAVGIGLLGLVGGWRAARLDRKAAAKALAASS